MKIYEQITFDFNDAAPPKEPQPLPQPQPAIGVRIKSLKQPPIFPEDATQVPATVVVPADSIAAMPAISAPEIVEVTEEKQAPLPEVSTESIEEHSMPVESEPIEAAPSVNIVEEKYTESEVVFEPADETPVAITAPQESSAFTTISSLPVPDETAQENAPIVTPASRSKSGRGRKSLKEMEASVDFVQIPPDEVLFQKQYYSIGEVAEMFGVNQSLLRFWENEFDILQPRKNRKGDRHFRPVDIKNLELIYDLLRRRKLTIEGAKDFLRQNKMAKERFELIQSLQNIRGFLLEIKAKL